MAEETVRKYHRCQVGRDYGHKPVLHGKIHANCPWHALAVDIMGPFPVSRGKRFVIMFQDTFSGYNIQVASPDHTAEQVVWALVEKVIAYFGTPERMLNDRGREFVGHHVWDQLERVFGCIIIRTSPYNLQGNGRVESSHKKINNLIRVTSA